MGDGDGLFSGMELLVLLGSSVAAEGLPTAYSSDAPGVI